MNVALIQMMAQIDNSTHSSAQSLATACARIAEAARQGADLVILPEMFSCPYQTAAFPLFSQPQGGENFTILQQCARENGVYLVAGSMPESDAENLYNTSFVFNPHGEMIAKHRKMHLFDIEISGRQVFKESDTLSAGNAVTVFDTPFGKMGLLLCFDIRFPELSRLTALKGAQCLIIPGAFNMTTGPAHWDLLFRARALDNQLYAIGVAPARDAHGSYVSYGHSLVVSPWGEIVAQLGDEDATLYYDVDLSENTRIRAQIPQILHRRQDVYGLQYGQEIY